MRYREPFTVYPRKMRSGLIIWYYQTYDEKGKRTSARSTGQTCKSAARAYCRKLQKEGCLVPRASDFLSFEAYAEDWWIPGKCKYLKYKLPRRDLSHRYIQSAKHILDNRLLPYFGKMRIRKISSHDVDNWMEELFENGVSSGSINLYKRILHIMLKEAVRREILETDVTKQVETLKATTTERGTFPQDVVNRLFDQKTIFELWDRKEYYYANLLAACTGMRISEVVGLQFSDLKDGIIYVTKQYVPGVGLQPTKNKKPRNIPIPDVLVERLLSLPHDINSDFIFSKPASRKEPVTVYMLSYNLFKALEKIGIDKEKRLKSRYSFHSWRHYFNTIMRSNNISDSKLQSMTGHSSTAMTDHYTHYDAEDLKEIGDVQAKIIPFSQTG